MIPPRRSSPAFTLVEMTVVILIIAVLVALSFAGINAAQNAARKAQVKNELGQIITAVKGYYSDYGSYPLVDLKFNDQVNPLLHKLFGILNCGRGVILVVQDQQIHSGGGGRCCQTLAHRLGKRHFARLRAKAEAHLPRSGHQPVESVLGLSEVPSVRQGF